MRTLRFIAEGQVMRQDPSCDFNNLVPGTESYIQAEFDLSPDWNDSVIIAAFRSNMGIEYAPQRLTEKGTCMIPVEALKRRIFKVNLIGQTRGGARLVTNKVEVRQNGGMV